MEFFKIIKKSLFGLSPWFNKNKGKKKSKRKSKKKKKVTKPSRVKKKTKSKKKSPTKESKKKVKKVAKPKAKKKAKSKVKSKPKKATSKSKKKAKPVKKKVQKKKAKPAKAKPAAKKSADSGLFLVGYVNHYFPKAKAAAFILDSGSLEVGDKIQIVGEKTSFKQVIDSMQINREPIEKAKRGDEIGIRVKKDVHVHDAVYKIG